MPPIEGLADARPWNNRDATAVKDIPPRFLVLGGGPIGAELAQAFHRLGSKEVTVVDYDLPTAEDLDRLLEGIVQSVKGNPQINTSLAEEEREHLLEAAIGLTANEA